MYCHGSDMYWYGSDENIPEFLKKEERKARKEHECCECGEIIPIGAKYLYFVGKWPDPVWGEPFFDSYKMCLSCDRDWQAVINVFKKNGERDACVILMWLKEAIENALECGFLREDDPLVLRWSLGAIDARTEEEARADFWKKIEASNIREGLQSTLPGL